MKGKIIELIEDEQLVTFGVLNKVVKAMKEDTVGIEKCYTDGGRFALMLTMPQMQTLMKIILKIS